MFSRSLLRHLPRPSSVSVRSFSTAAPQPLNASRVEITRTTAPKTKLPLESLVFGRTFSDHMIDVDWTVEKGWENPRILPYGNLSLPPSATVFHYAIECFEGMKAYKDAQGRIRLFRPDMNMKRMNHSTARLHLPTFDGNQLVELIKELLRIDADWVPSKRGYSLYLRPTAIGTQDSLGVGASSKAKIFVIASPVGPYFKSGFDAVSLFADPKYVRAWPGGTGDSKVGGNYAPTIYPQAMAAKAGHQQVLWLFGPQHEVTEVGTMNLFVFWKNEKGENELVTPPLDGTILPGVTRDSILGLAREWKEFKVTERKLYMGELTEALQSGRVQEMFGAGTACIVCPIRNIEYLGKNYAVPLNPKDPAARSGPLAMRFADTIMGIQYGEIEHKWSVVV